jgi:hypothetical protein
MAFKNHARSSSEIVLLARAFSFISPPPFAFNSASCLKPSSTDHFRIAFQFGFPALSRKEEEEEFSDDIFAFVSEFDAARNNERASFPSFDLSL